MKMQGEEKGKMQRKRKRDQCNTGCAVNKNIFFLRTKIQHLESVGEFTLSVSKIIWKNNANMFFKFAQCLKIIITFLYFSFD